MNIQIEVFVNASLEKAWLAWVTPEDICQWNFASDDWCCPRASMDLQVGGSFNWRMEAVDGSMGFDFEGVFTQVVPQQLIQYELGDGRQVRIEFTSRDGGVLVVESFDTEDENSAEMQRQGWQAILNNFQKHVERVG